MKKQNKEQLLEMIGVLSKTNDEIKKCLDRNQNIIAQEMLNKEQDAAINVGNMIESWEGEGFITVKYLEEYCELLFQLHEEIGTATHINPNNIYKKLNKNILKIENSIKNDIAVKKVVVFLPYKASMWDSLESVWKAADKDPNCDAYVIPIPYYDKNTDGSFKEMHYEGNDYPKYVPITDYQTFNLEKNHPDEIYIHNPYDGYNIVTSVHPYFYSNNLVKFTDKLVYIPYFVLEEPDVNNDAALEGIKHFFTVPAVLNAHQVIVQSENMKNAYIKILCKTYGEQTRKIWENKILGTGSPKFDKVMNSKKEEQEIPEEWLDIIRKPDGSWKKIIFYNNSVGSLLSNNEKMIKKIEDVLKIFKENKDEVALLWRPHPLIKSTIESMRPDLWEEYDNIVINYIAEGWGIYDDTPDMDRAIIISDAYYGDGSSIVQLYQKTGKPIMIQNVDVIVAE